MLGSRLNHVSYGVQGIRNRESNVIHVIKMGWSNIIYSSVEFNSTELLMSSVDFYWFPWNFIEVLWNLTPTTNSTECFVIPFYAISTIYSGQEFQQFPWTFQFYMELCPEIKFNEIPWNPYTQLRNSMELHGTIIVPRRLLVDKQTRAPPLMIHTWWYIHISP